MDECKSTERQYICAECREPMHVPFTNDDDKVRCAACAVDRYMQLTPSALSQVPMIRHAVLGDPNTT